MRSDYRDRRRTANQKTDFLLCAKLGGPWPGQSNRSFFFCFFEALSLPSYRFFFFFSLASLSLFTSTSLIGDFFDLQPGGLGQSARVLADFLQVEQASDMKSRKTAGLAKHAADLAGGLFVGL